MSGFSKNVRALVTARAGGRCEKCGITGHGLQYHHRRPRGMGSTRRPDSNQAANCVLVCPDCHSHIESYRTESIVEGWLVRQHKQPSETPIWRHSLWVFLDDYGYVTPMGETA